MRATSGPARCNEPVRWRPAVAVASGLGALLVVVAVLGLPSGPAGVGDNGDGYRLYCGAGLVPATVDGQANWRGGVVLDFATGRPACPDPVVSSALPLLELAGLGAGPVWSLSRLGLLYALAVGVATGVAVAALGRRSAVLLPALVPLAGTTFSRFFVSTYSEPAGLLGACVLLLGAGVLAVTGPRDRVERITGLLLTAGGGVLAATAKPSYAPLLLVAVVACAAVALRVRGGQGGGWRDRVAGPLAAALAVVLAVGPVAAAVGWQDRNYPVVNAHNLVFTLVLPEVGVAALGPLGLPPAAAGAAGRAYYPEGANGYPGSDVVAADPAGVRAAAHGLLLAHPGAVVTAVGVGLTATLGAGLGYLPADPLSPGSVPPVLGSTVGEQGADRAQLTGWLAGLPVPWLPAAVALAGIVAGLLTRGRGGALGAFGAVAGLAAVSAVGLVVVAVLGDGYFEIAKHVWLSAYLLAATAVALVLLVPARLMHRRTGAAATTARTDPVTLRPWRGAGP